MEETVAEGRVSSGMVEWLWREEGLQIPERHKKRKRLYHKDSSVIRLRPRYPNHIWSIDVPRENDSPDHFLILITP